MDDPALDDGSGSIAKGGLTHQLAAARILPMAVFTSVREKRYWLAAAVVVVLIFSTLGLAQTFAEELRDQGIISDAFWLGLWLVVAAVAVLGLKTRPGWAVVGASLGILGVYVLAFARMGTPEERSHLIEYGVVAILIHEALKERAGEGGALLRPALLAIAMTAAVGMVDEVIQGLLPNRVFDVRDIAFNAIAGAMAVAASVTLSWTRNRFGRRTQGP